MELPINIIVILFVAVSVGAAVLFFSQQIFVDAKQGMHTLNVERNDQSSNIIETNNEVNAAMVRALAEECVKKSHGVPYREVCFVVKGSKGNIIDAHNTNTIESNFTIVTQSIIGGNVTMFYYDPTGRILVEY
jgi:hypothetical protein